MDRVFTYRNLVHAVAGMCGGASAITAFYPLNSVRTRLQVSDAREFKGVLQTMVEIAEKEGVGALYQGWRAAVVSLGASNFLYFYAYNALKAAYSAHLARTGRRPDIGAAANLAIASVAGVANVLATTPLWVVGTRLTVQQKARDSGGKVPYKGICDALTRIASEEGVGALWNGTGPSLILVSNPSIQFVTYERLRRLFARNAAAAGRELHTLEFFLMGAIAKAVATVVTYPLQIAQSRLRSSRVKAKGAVRGATPDASRPTYAGTIDCLRQLYAKDGVRGWYRGMSAKLWQTVLTAAFQFTAYETIQSAVMAVLLRNKEEAAAAVAAVAAK